MIKLEHFLTKKKPSTNAPYIPNDFNILVKYDVHEIPLNYTYF